jgi:hypothetical protein
LCKALKKKFTQMEWSPFKLLSEKSRIQSYKIGYKEEGWRMKKKNGGVHENLWHQRRPHHRLNPNLVGTKFAMEENKKLDSKKSLLKERKGSSGWWWCSGKRKEKKI